MTELGADPPLEIMLTKRNPSWVCSSPEIDLTPERVPVLPQKRPSKGVPRYNHRSVPR